MNTYNDIYLEVRKKLRSHGISAHDLEARLIVAHASGKTREELMIASRMYLPDKTIIAKIDEMIERRLLGEPVAYIVGEWEFYGLPIVVNRTVLIPRVDTEVLAAEAIRFIRQRDGSKRLLDLCAGSGAVGLAISANVPDCRVVLAEKSENALSICRENMLKNRLSRNVTAIAVDVFENPPALLGAFDAVVCNPPYIPTADINGLDISVRDYEPTLALDGGSDGLEFFREITKNWTILIKQGGLLLFECGAGQAPAVKEIMKNSGLVSINTKTDTLGIERVVTGMHLATRN